MGYNDIPRQPKREAVMIQSLIERGFAVIPDALDTSRLAGLLDVIESYCTSKARGTGRAVHAIRNLFTTLPELAGIIDSPAIRNLIEPVLGRNAFTVRAIYFDKLPEANWKVPWHQDQAIAVYDQLDTPGFGPWSIKEGVHHVEPPVSVLEQMLTLRIHLDDCVENNGPLRVIPGSHRMGRLMPDDTDRLKRSNGEACCCVAAGGAVLMRPLLLHASSLSVSPSHRRVIHIEFAASHLPGGLAWAGPVFPIRP